MPVITITACELLRYERHQLLMVVTEEIARSKERPFLKKLLRQRLLAIRNEMAIAQCPEEPDEAQYLDAIREIEEEP
jgi:hypothetical protein